MMCESSLIEAWTAILKLCDFENPFKPPNTLDGVCATRTAISSDRTGLQSSLVFK